MEFPKTLSKFYWSVIKKFPLFFISMFILKSVVYMLDMVSFPYTNKWIFQIFEVAPTSTLEQVSGLLVLVIVIWMMLWGLDIIKSFIDGRVQPIVKRYTAYLLYKRTYANDTEFFINRPAGQIANKVGEVQGNLMSICLEFWSDIVSIAVGFLLISGTLFSMNMWLAVAVLACGIVRSSWQFLWQKPINKVSKKLVDISSEISGIRTDSIGNAIVSKLFGNTDYENDYIWKKQQKEITMHQHSAFLRRVQHVPASFIWFFMMFLIVVMCWFLIRDGQIAISDAAFAFVGCRTIGSMFARLTTTLKDYSENRAKAKHAFADIMAEQKITDKPGAKNLKITRAEIDFEKMSFNYGGADVIKSFDLHVGHNEKIGIVGLSGAGKTTLVNLILRMYDVKAGAIKVDGTDIRDVKQDSLRRQIAFVPQESDLFNRTLLENIRYAKPNASRAAVIAAAKKANIHDFIMDQPNKYETIVGNRGIKLSGGQRQRIAIARAILKDAPILILDEATSALDSKNEVLIQGALQKIMAGKTTIAIAHRLSTLRNMDRIIVMDRGRIAESGTHTQLLRKNGIYKKLWGMQTGGFIGE